MRLYLPHQRQFFLLQQQNLQLIHEYCMHDKIHTSTLTWNCQKITGKDKEVRKLRQVSNPPANGVTGLKIFTRKHKICLQLIPSCTGLSLVSGSKVDLL